MDTVIGVFPTREHAEAAIEELNSRGYEYDDISVIVKEDANMNRAKGGEVGADMADGAVSGAIPGGVLGGLAGLLIGLGAIAVPGLGGLFIAGPLAAALGLTGAAATTLSGAATGALAGGLIGALASLGLPRDVATYYEQRVREGGVVVAVPATHMDTEEVRRIMKNRGAGELQTIAAA